MYSDALNVVCLWLRSHLNARFQGLATLSDILDIIITDFPNYLDVSKKDLSLHIFFCLARQDCKPFDLLCRLLPEMKFPEVCSGIVEKFLALPSMYVRLIHGKRSCITESFHFGIGGANQTQPDIIVV